MIASCDREDVVLMGRILVESKMLHVPETSMQNFRRGAALLTALWLPLSFPLWLLVSATEARAQSYPTKPIRIIVGFAPAGAADIFARILGQKLTDAWAQTVVVENRPGAGSTLGSEIAANSVPDGH